MIRQSIVPALHSIALCKWVPAVAPVVVRAADKGAQILGRCVGERGKKRQRGGSRRERKGEAEEVEDSRGCFLGFSVGARPPRREHASH